MKQILLSLIFAFISLSLNAQKITLNIAIVQNNYEKVQELLDHGYRVSGQDRQGNISINIATYHKNKRILELLLNYGANINESDRNGNTPLLIAAQINDLEMVQYIINQGAIIDTPSKYGRTAVITSIVTNGKHGLEILDLLYKNGADLNKYDNFNKTALDYAKTDEIINFLELNGAVKKNKL